MASTKKISIIAKDNLEERSNVTRYSSAGHQGKFDISNIQHAKERKSHILGYDPENKGPKFGTRHVQIILIFLCMTIGFAMRTNLSVAIVAMTNSSTSSNSEVPTYTWTNTSVILSSFFWGYICLQVLAGYMAKTYGPKYFLLVSFFVNSVAFSLIPIAAAQQGSIGVMICRIFQGLSQGFLFPSGHTILGRWAPAEERSTMGIVVYSGVGCGSILSSIITGYLSSSDVGWPSSFYLFGGLGVAWCVLYLSFGHNSPDTHPRITKEERKYIEVSLGQQEHTQVIPTPWKSIICCVHLWAIVLANIGNAWGYAMMMTQIPTYLAKVMDFDMKSNGLVSAIPYMVGTVFGFIFAPISDYLIEKRYISTINARRFFHIFGSYLQAICLLLLAYLSTTKITSILLLAIGNAAYSSTLCGYAINHIDLSPRFSGIMQGISNATSQTFAIFSPLLVQFVVTNPEDESEWRIIFTVAAIIYFVTSTLFTIFASATRQKWDGPAIANQDRIKKASVISITGY